MKRTGMSIHSPESFNESEGINILSSVLESKHTIKTYFSANDRTPNHDGFFELTSDNSPPKKQFIVQIKKVEDLQPNKKGANKGKYVYRLRTNFLYYVKERVTENPAIYFVVDIITKRIFWLYLSDSVLMDLDFEGHEKVLYAFSEDNILTDISSFTDKLNAIADERNRLFLKKTSAEIADLQEAVDYINHLLDYDFSFIKRTLFPRLWRFGIKYSNTSNLSVRVNGISFTPAVSSLIALYPQIKGVPDTGVREYYPESSDFLQHIVLDGKAKPIEYSRESLQKIIKCFFEGRIPVRFLPDIALEELIGVFMDESNHLFSCCSHVDTIELDEAEKRFCYLACYIRYLLLCHSPTQSESRIRSIINMNYQRGIRHFCRFANLIALYGGMESFKQYQKENLVVPRVFDPILFDLMDIDYIQFYCCIQELKVRSIDSFATVWDYSNTQLRKLPVMEFDAKANRIIERWFRLLPSLYEETYKKLFNTDKYRMKGKYIYKCNGEEYRFGNLLHLFSVILYCPESSFTIIHDKSIITEFTEENKKRGVARISSGMMLDDFLSGKALFYNSILCLLYQGICNELGFKPQGLKTLKKASKELLLFD